MLTHWIWYSRLPNISVRQKLMLLERFSDPQDLFHIQDYSGIPEITPEMAESLLNKDLTEARKIIKTCTELRIGILTMQDVQYPGRLRRIDEAPLVLYCKGMLPDLDSMPAIGVVGTRKASTYGEGITKKLTKQIAVCGGLVVSGGAAGIDTVALEAALSVGMPVVAVLGCGVDVAYPKENRKLFDRIAEKGCLISEYIPGTGPKPWQFPERNRIISGISNGVLVTEAPEKSGALITAARALSQGKDVYVIPGNIDVASCAGSNSLLQEGASAVFSGWDVVKNYASQYPDVAQREYIEQKTDETEAVHPEKPVSDKKAIDNSASDAYSEADSRIEQLDPLSQKVLAAMDDIPEPMDAVLARVDAPAQEIMGILTKLSLEGFVQIHPGRQVSLKGKLR